MYGGIGLPPKAEHARPTGKAFKKPVPARKFRRISGNRLRSKGKGKMRQQISFARVDFVDTQKPADMPAGFHHAKYLLDRTFHLAAAQATGANAHPLGRATHDHTHTLRIGRPSSPRLFVRMAHVVAGRDAFMAHFTKFAHLLHLLQASFDIKTAVLYHSPEANATPWDVKVDERASPM
jgi:hypothetical protein